MVELSVFEVVGVFAVGSVLGVLLRRIVENAFIVGTLHHISLP